MNWTEFLYELPSIFSAAQNLPTMFNSQASSASQIRKLYLGESLLSACDPYLSFKNVITSNASSDVLPRSRPNLKYIIDF